MCTVHCTGFFENKEADAKARGEAPPKKQTAAEAFSDSWRRCPATCAR